MMVADYKKGRALVDLLQSTRNKLSLVSRLDPKSEKIAAEREACAKLAEDHEEDCYINHHDNTSCEVEIARRIRARGGE